MKLTKEVFIHNRITFEETERDILSSAYKIVANIRNENIHSCGADDTYLHDQCTNIMNGISELLDNYTNEYPEPKED